MILDDGFLNKAKLVQDVDHLPIGGHGSYLNLAETLAKQELNHRFIAFAGEAPAPVAQITNENADIGDHVIPVAGGGQ